MKFFVYVIVTKKDKKLISYVGYTNNIKNRLIKHNSSMGAKYTRGKIWKLAYSKVYYSKSEAMKEEYKLKKNIKFRNLIKKKFNS